MNRTGMRQRLTAILAADAVGYSRLMTADPHATVAALDTARAIFRQQITANEGRVVDTAGDSVLAVFETAAGAVAAALAIQQELRRVHAEVPQDRRLQFRIGVHLGDVIEKADGTVYGEGVNIAARLQALGDAGGIVVSDAVRGSVKNRLEAAFDDLGEQSVKNISDPVRAFRIRVGTAGTTIKARPRTMKWAASAAAAAAVFLLIGVGWYAGQRGAPAGRAMAEAKSIAVLPFANMSDDKDTAYFADGVHEDLLTQLALLGDVRVVSRVSVMDYRNTKKNVRQIGSELGVASLVEGSVRRSGNIVRVTAQLVDARADKHLWAKSYDRELKDIFAIQSQLATEIAESLKVSLEPEQRARLAKQPTTSPEAYDLLLRHQQLAHQTAGSIRFTSMVDERAALLVKAVALDPDFGLAWARLAADHALAYRNTDKTPARLDKARDAFEHAQKLAAADPLVKIEAGTYYRLALNDLPRASSAYEEVLAAAPYNVDALVGLAIVRGRQMNFTERVALLERALIVDPRNPDTLDQLSWVYNNFRQYERSLALRRELMALRPADDELKADYYYIEYLRTGSWDAYDEWRRGLARDAASRIDSVKHLDMDRALARGDLDEVLRLIDVDAQDARNIQQSRCACKEVPRVLTLRAKGDGAGAAKVARAAMQLAESELKKNPDDRAELIAKGFLHAIGGERDKAFAALGQAVAVEKKRGNLCAAAHTERLSLQLHALLGDRKEALEELSRQLHLPGAHAHDLRLELSFIALRDEPEFKLLINDPANRAPISFAMKCGG